jgi:hypothetical protein
METRVEVHHGVVPESRPEFLSAHDLPGTFQQGHQQSERQILYFDPSSVSPEFIGRLIDFKVAKLSQLVLRGMHSQLLQDRRFP